MLIPRIILELVKVKIISKPINAMSAVRTVISSILIRTAIAIATTIMTMISV